MPVELLVPLVLRGQRRVEVVHRLVLTLCYVCLVELELVVGELEGACLVLLLAVVGGCLRFEHLRLVVLVAGVRLLVKIY